MSEQERREFHRNLLREAREKIDAYKRTLAAEKNRSVTGQPADPDRSAAAAKNSGTGHGEGGGAEAGSEHPRPRRHNIPTYMRDHLASKGLFRQDESRQPVD
jgi:hypothetical protein